MSKSSQFINFVDIRCFQAVILADDFNINLNPIQCVYPSILIPVANTPLLDYLVKSLIESDITELFIFCSSHIDMLKNYISSKKYTNISISLIISDGCRSLGDALRDIDAKDCIRGRFVLIRGDAFFNSSLIDLMDRNYLMTKEDKGALMTLVLRNVGSAKNSVVNNENCLFVTDKMTDKILFYKKSIVKEKKIKFDIELFLNHEKININHGFIDSHIYICSPAVLPLFTDNFDYQTIEDFIKGVLINEEVLNSRIYWLPLHCAEYALPITSWSTYHILNRDILERQNYPLTPDTLCPFNGIISTSRNIYKHSSAALAKGCILQKDKIIGKNTILGKNTIVNRSVIDSNCTIGDNVLIENSYILNNVIINNDCVIRNSVLFSNSHLNSNVKLDICIVMPGVEVSSESNYVDNILEQENGQLITKNINHHDEEYDKISFFKECLLDPENCNSSSESNSFDSDLSSAGSSRNKSPSLDDTHMFLNEVIDSLLRGYQDKLNCENLILEINSSRYAYNVGISEVTYNVVKAILLLPLQYLSEVKSIVDGPNYQKTLKTMLIYFHTILLNYIKTDNAQQECLKAIEDVSDSSQQLLNFSKHLLLLFYQKDILSEDNILQWWNKNPIDEDEIYNKRLRDNLQPFIKWLNEAEEGSSQSNDED